MNDFTEAVNDIRNKFIERVRREFLNEVSYLLSENENDETDIDDNCNITKPIFTPIETMFFLELLWSVRIKKRVASYVYIRDEVLFENKCIYLECQSFYLMDRGVSDKFVIEINPQKVIETENGNYRVDFLFLAPCNWDMKENMIRLCVELDGHDFHDKSKEQAQRDKQRDRDLQKAGYNVIHYTGSEIYRDPASVMMDVFYHLCFLMADKFATLGFCQREPIPKPESKEPLPF